MSKMVVYYSHSGVTRKRAVDIAAANGAAIFELHPKVPYTEADVNWQNDTSRSVVEYKDSNSRPEIDVMPDLSDVDELWVGYPIWWYTTPRIINTFFDNAVLKGKKVHLFATSSVTGVDESLDELRSLYPDVDIVDAKRV
ncbi:MAG: flavodoxin [Acetatifactor sp.]|nr:flavodoxin [Acetatifactor sp.]